VSPYQPPPCRKPQEALSQEQWGWARGESAGFLGSLVTAINLITSRSPRLPVSLPKAAAGFAADSHTA
jgi:hypothetical protein